MKQQTVSTAEFTPAWTQQFRETVLGLMNRMVATQAVAADANVAFKGNASPLVLEPGFIRELAVIFPVAPAADETMSVDIHVSRAGGSYATILSAPRVYGLAAATGITAVSVGAKMSLMDLLSSKSVDVGDRIRLVLDYTAGGGPTPVVDTTVLVDISK